MTMNAFENLKGQLEEVDFDAEFETWSPGVYARYQEKFGYDYQEWAQETIFRELVDALAEKGYCLAF